MADDLMNVGDWRGSGTQIQSRPNQYANGTSVLELPDLRGELTVYLGGGEGGLYQNLMKRIQGLYENFSVNIRLADSSQLANTIIEESSASSSPADIFWAIDAGSIGVVASEGATQPLPDRVTAEVPDTYAPTDNWVGTIRLR
jgi:iron(III) transport system substrate-binding protein